MFSPQIDVKFRKFDPRPLFYGSASVCARFSTIGFDHAWNTDGVAQLQKDEVKFGIVSKNME